MSAWRTSLGVSVWGGEEKQTYEWAQNFRMRAQIRALQYFFSQYQEDDTIIDKIKRGWKTHRANAFSAVAAFDVSKGKAAILLWNY